MPKYLVLDDEQGDLLAAGFAAIDAVLAARILRADPDRIVSASLELQRNKVAAVNYQLRIGPLPRWLDLEEPERARMVDLLDIAMNAENDQSRGAVFDALVGFLLECRKVGPAKAEEPQRD